MPAARKPAKDEAHDCERRALRMTGEERGTQPYGIRDKRQRTAAILQAKAETNGKQTVARTSESRVEFREKAGLPLRRLPDLLGVVARRGALGVAREAAEQRQDLVELAVRRGR